MKYIKTTTLVMLLLFIQNCVIAQSPLWTLPGNLKSMSPGGSTNALPMSTVDPYGGAISWPEAYDGRKATATHNAMHDSNGDLLFFMLDGYIYDKNGYLISKEFYDAGLIGASDLFIVPIQGNCNKFYIFTTPAGGFIESTFYSVLDMTLDSWETGPLGRLEFSPKNMQELLLGSPPLIDEWKVELLHYNHSVTVSPLNGNNERFVFVNSGKSIFRFKIDNNGVLSFDNYIWDGINLTLPVGRVRNPDDLFKTSNSVGLTEMEIIALPDGNYRIAFEMTYENSLVTVSQEYASICIIDMDGNTMDFISGSERFFEGEDIIIGYQDFYFAGLEFTSNGDLLYITHETPFNGNTITVIDINSMQVYNPSFGVTPGIDLSDFQHSQIELGMDGAMYLTSKNHLAKISTPNNLSTATISIVQAYEPLNVMHPYDPSALPNAFLYYLPSQIDGEDAFQRFSSSCCRELDGYTEIFTADTGIQTWTLGSNPFNNATAMVRVRNKIIIPNGANIEIKNMTFLFDEDATLIIEKGGNLTLDGTTLTSDACKGIMWKGVELQGDKNAKQYRTTQGYIELKNGSIIENAYIGISTKKVTPYGWDANSTGGFIRAKDSYFLNNQLDVEFLSYHLNPSVSNPIYESSNRSWFSNCQFIINDNYLETVVLPNVKLWDVNGVNFNNGCLFTDNRNVVAKTRRVGISSVNASYAVNNSKFENLEYGIRAFETDYFIGLNNGKFISVINSFFDCHRGIYFSGLDKSIVTQNIFNTNHSGVPSSNLYGLYLDFCKNYTIEENEFNNTGHDLHGAFTCGILVANRSGEPTEIYKNKFDRHAIGIQAIDQNRTPASDCAEGLNIRCNTFANTVVDIFAAKSNTTSFPVTGIRPFQGNPGTVNGLGLADNQFAASYANTNYDNASGNTGVSYFHSVGLNPNLHHPSIVLFETSIGGGVNTCPSNIGVFPYDNIESMASLFEMKAIVLPKLVAAQENYNQLVEGGEMSALESEMIATTDEEAYNIYLDLMGKAGYLSEEVLKEVAEKEDGFTVAMIRNVLVANPHAAKINEIENILDNRENKLPNYMRSQIRLGKTTLSTREILSLEVSKFKKELDVIMQSGIKYIAYDTVTFDSSAMVLDLISNTGLAKYEMERLKIYLNQNNESKIEETQAVLNSFELSEGETQYITDLIDYNAYKKGWKDSGYPIYDLPEGQIDKLNDLAFGNTLSASNAHAVLALNNELKYEEPVYMPEMSQSFNRSVSLDELESTDEFMLLYPNPTSDEVWVKYKYAEPYTNLALTVTDMLGREVYTRALTEAETELVISFDGYTNGSYIITISADEKVVYSDKLMKK